MAHRRVREEAADALPDREVVEARLADVAEGVDRLGALGVRERDRVRAERAVELEARELVLDERHVCDLETSCGW